MKLICDCGKKPKLVDTISKFAGHQISQRRVGIYKLYQCSCGNKHWDFVRD